MIFYLLMCNILVLPLIQSSNTTASKPEIPRKSLSESRMVNNFHNETKVTLISEGGSLLPETSVLALPKEKETIMSLVDTELGKNKIKPVVARKGVVYEETTEKTQQKVPATSNDPSTIAPKISEITNVSFGHSNTTNKFIISKSNSTLLKKISSSVKTANKTEIHKKPSVLSYDALANMTLVSSSQTLVHNQIQSPTKGLKIYAQKANSHPGMIMPLVITILLVPMFAVLGYMALRRGQEAWKNRHYKRMDFLLDGMYND